MVCPWVYQPHSRIGPVPRSSSPRQNGSAVCECVGGLFILFWKWQILREQISTYGKSWYEEWVALPGLFERFSKNSPICHSWAWPHIIFLCDLWQSSELPLSLFCNVGLRSEFLQLDRMTLRARAFLLLYMFTMPLKTVVFPSRFQCNFEISFMLTLIKEGCKTFF